MAVRAAEVAAGTTASTKIAISFAEGELSWTAQEPGLSSINDENVVDPLHKKSMRFWTGSIPVWS